MKTVFSMVMSIAIILQTSEAQEGAEQEKAAPTIDAIGKWLVEEAKRLLAKKLEYENQIENAKKRIWDEQPAESKIAPGECPSIAGEWSDSVRRPTMTIIQRKTGNVVVRCRLMKQLNLWRFTGRITEDGHIEGRLTDHIKSKNGSLDQTLIAVVSRDGKTITGRAIFNNGEGFDFVWKKEEK